MLPPEIPERFDVTPARITSYVRCTQSADTVVLLTVKGGCPQKATRVHLPTHDSVPKTTVCRRNTRVDLFTMAMQYRASIWRSSCSTVHISILPKSHAGLAPTNNMHLQAAQGL